MCSLPCCHCKVIYVCFCLFQAFLLNAKLPVLAKVASAGSYKQDPGPVYGGDMQSGEKIFFLKKKNIFVGYLQKTSLSCPGFEDVH